MRILDQTYISAKDLKKIMPTVGINQCRRYIEEAQEEMKEKNIYIPEGKTKIALTKIIKKRFGL